MLINQTAVLAKRESGAFRAIFQATIITGLLDGLAAIILFLNGSGENPIILFNYIASAVLGSVAFAGGFPVALLGLILHFLIAFVFSVLFYLIYPQVYRLKLNPLISGIFYGVFIWFVMNMLVLPFTLIPHTALNIKECLIGIIVLMLFAGIPIAFILDRHHKQGL